MWWIHHFMQTSQTEATVMPDTPFKEMMCNYDKSACYVLAIFKRGFWTLTLMKINCLVDSQLNLAILQASVRHWREQKPLFSWCSSRPLTWFYHLKMYNLDYIRNTLHFIPIMCVFLAFLPQVKKCPVWHTLSDTLVEWQLLTPLGYPWVKKKILLKPTYDVGEQNYLA